MDEEIPQLSTGACEEIASSTGSEDAIWSTSPVLQIVQAKVIETNGQTRWRTVISDGVNVLQAMVVTQLNVLFENGDIGKGSIVRIQRFAINMIQGRRIVIILGLEVLAKEVERIGNPTPRTLDPPGTTSKPPSAAGSGTRPPPPKPSRQTLPIEGLSPYSNNWTIKARVTQKSEIRTWSNQRGEGRLFSVTLMDETGEIRGTGFNLVVDSLYDKLQEGKVYYISKARVNLAKKKFNNVANDYELALERNTEVEECTDQSDVPEIKYNFVKLDELINKPKDTTCDVIGIVSEVGELSTIATKANRMASKRELTLVDRSNSSIRLTLWGKQAESYEGDGTNPVIAFKGVKVGEFLGRSLSMISTSIMSINPDITDSHVLRGWYDSVGINQSFTAYSNTALGSGGGATFNRAEIRTIEDIKANLQAAEKAEMFSCRGTILHIKGDNPAYPACPNQSCKKKVTEDGESWRCEKCDRTWEKPEYRYIISMAVSDHTGQAWLQGFHDVGLAVFNMSADDLMEIKNNDPAKYPALLSKSSYSTFNFACRAKLDTWQDQSRVRYGISKIIPLNYREEAGYLKDLIKSNWAH